MTGGSSPRRRRAARAAGIGLTLAAAAAGCAGKPVASQPGGVLTIGVSTTGVPPAAAFPISITAPGGSGTPQAGSIQADGGVATFRSLAEGAYTVALTLPPQCEAQGGRERRIQIGEGRTTAVRFSVRCR